MADPEERSVGRYAVLESLSSNIRESCDRCLSSSVKKRKVQADKQAHSNDNLIRKESSLAVGKVEIWCCRNRGRRMQMHDAPGWN